MKYWYLLFLFFTTVEVVSAQSGTVNPVIGDTSYLFTYSKLPTIHTDEQLRIRTHLRYVEQRLRTVSTTHLSDTLRQKRLHALDLLREYADAGQFPLNTAYSNERRPCFIDDFGTICAVGYLIEQTAGRKVVRRINGAYQYAFIKDMSDELPFISQWAVDNGLTLRECAMIQPTYYVVELKRYSFGVVAGPTFAFGRVEQQYAGGEMRTLPGIETGFSYNQRIHGRFWFTSGLLFNRRSVAISGDSYDFRLQNDRVILPLLLRWSVRPIAGKNFDKFAVMFGVQLAVGVLDRPDAERYRANYGNFLAIDTRPELDACIGLSYSVMQPLLLRGMWTLRYNHGLLSRQSGILKRGGETLLIYQLPGHYIGLTYTYPIRFGKGYRMTYGG